MEVEPTPTTAAPLPAMVEIVNSDYRCVPCVAICNTRQMLEMHLSGKKHVSKIALCGGESAFRSIAELSDLPTEALSPQGRKRKNISAQGQFRCDLCEIDFPSAFPFESHMQGKKHMNKAQKKEQGDTPTTVSCAICSVSCPSKETYDLHVNGKKHLAKVAALDKGGATGGGVNNVVPLGEFKCEDCSIFCTNSDTLEIHMQGKKHLAKVGKVNVESFHCEFCDVTVNNKELFESHRNGKRHADKVRKIAEGEAGDKVTCDVCQVTLPKVAMEAHLAGKKHQKKVGGGDANGGGGGSSGGGGAAPDSLTCDVCNISVTSPQLMDMHKQGKKHLKATGAVAVAPASLYCNVCSIQMNSPQMMEMHLGGKSHSNKLTAANRENASAMATSLIQSVREETEGDTKMAEPEGTKSQNGKQPLEPVEQQQPQAIPNIATMAPAASPGRPARARRAN